jgi:hypothetical protein
MKTQKNIVWMLTVIMIFIATVFLLPKAVIAGSLEPPPYAFDEWGDPQPTMMTPPSWSQKLPCDETTCPRFELVMNDKAVLDKNTGLVWHREPSTQLRQWSSANLHCHNQTLAGTKGWRLPRKEELLSLLLSLSGGLSLIPGHPFDTDCSDSWCVQQATYWTNTSNNLDYDQVFVVPIGDSFPYSVFKRHELNDGVAHSAWCVRGGFGPDIVAPNTIDGAVCGNNCPVF